MSNQKNANASDTPAFEKTRGELFDQCGDLLNQKNILSLLNDHLRVHGFAGSAKIPLVIFLTAITRMFEEPVSCVIKGQSGSGKSFALRSGLRYVPKSAFHEFHGMSAKALVRNEHLDFKHKLLVVQELAGMAKEGLVFLRQLLTEGEVKYMTVDQGRDGHEGKVTKGVEGPTGALMTTTREKMYWEDETRMVTFYVDQSTDQIDRAIMAFAEKPPKPSDADISAWHAVHEFVCSGNLEVIIPYRKELLTLMPRSRHRVLRDIPKVLALIRAHTLLQQCTRQKQDGTTIATLDDYAVVYDLIADALAFGLQASVPPHVSDVVNAALYLYHKTGTAVSQVEIAKHLDRDRGTVSRWLSYAITEGFLFNENPGQGRLHAYVPGEREIPSGGVLPTPDELRSLLEKKRAETSPEAAHQRKSTLLPGAKFAPVTAWTD